ncbi:flagellar protein FlaG [Sporosarcina sp. Te-1]|uniref:flagellar protein FlaG n=1 Tax=Sporosarcina sp. Te-1 TaxID=2818390 RepID=UPI001A9E89E1|nr:flagellar protein FlaG [Sporosarcina sp. Te-1]QTD41191.1 flagellar protein FlaG [Sporosarcina sp. Te-1]
MVGRIGGSTVPHIVPSAESAAPDTNFMVEEVQAISAQVQERADSEQTLPVEKAQQMTDSMNNFLESVNTQLRFKLHDQLNEYYVTIVDSKTDEVVREIPSKKLMDIYAAMKEFVGLLIDHKI